MNEMTMDELVDIYREASMVFAQNGDQDAFQRSTRAYMEIARRFDCLRALGFGDVLDGKRR